MPSGAEGAEGAVALAGGAALAVVVVVADTELELELELEAAGAVPEAAPRVASSLHPLVAGSVVATSKASVACRVVTGVFTGESLPSRGQWRDGLWLAWQGFADDGHRMNPGFVRLRLPLRKATQRFARWIALKEIAAPRTVSGLRVVDEATDDDGWLGSVVSFFEEDGWTVFEDHSGVLVDRSTEDWLRLARKDALIFGSYNDAVPMGEMLVIEGGELARELRHDPARPAWCKNVHRLPDEGDTAWTSWTDIAGFVDEDDVYGACPDEVQLWIFEPRDEDG